MDDLLHIAIAWSLPFIAGVIVGRGIRRPAVTQEHLLGAEIAASIARIRRKALIVGSEQFTISYQGTFTSAGKPDVSFVLASKCGVDA